MHSYPLLKNTTLIGLGHRARSGKDSAAQIIHQQFPRITRVYHFADALKAVCRALYGMTTKDGPLLQRVGTDELRRDDPEIWIRSLYWQIADDQPLFALIPDTRFLNEAEFIKSVDGFLIHTTRLNRDGSPFVADDRDPNHPSECELDGYKGWDKRIIATSGDMRSLEEQAILAFKDIATETAVEL